MARDYTTDDFVNKLVVRRHNVTVGGIGISLGALLVCISPVGNSLSTGSLVFLALVIPSLAAMTIAAVTSNFHWIERERKQESARRSGKPVLGMPPNRKAFEDALDEARKNGKSMIDKYLVGFEIDSGAPIWVTDDEICSHAAVFAKTGVGKTLWLEGLMVQQMARGRASGLTFIDAKRDPGTLADIIMMALLTGRIEDVVVVDPFDPVCSYNFVFTTQRADVKARKVLRCGLPPTSDQSTTKHYDRLAADAVYRVVRAMESLGLAWSVRDVAVALSAFTIAYPRMRDLLHEQGAKQAMIELGHLAGTYRTAKGSLDSARLTDNLRGIASELHSIANSEAGEMFCVPSADLSLTDAILRGKIIYYMLPRLEEAESAARMVKVFREDLEVSIGEITSSRTHHLEDPHLVIIDEGASTFGPTWANLFELARKGRFAMLFGAQSISGLMDEAMGLSQEFYDRVIANVNLKVIMRLGDNRTAEDMSEWIGMVNVEKKTIATGMSSSLNARELTKHIELNKRTADGFRDGFTFSEDETELVSTEELKHEMSAEKGLAWFDKGDGRLRKGRSIWFDADLPATWEGREFLTRYETVEADEIGLAEWVDEHILTVERSETQRKIDQDTAAEGQSGSSSYSGSNSSTPSYSSPTPTAETPTDAGAQSGGFRLNPLKGFRGMGRARVTVMESPPPSKPVAADKPAEPSAVEAKKPEAEKTDSSKQQNQHPAAQTVKPVAPAPEKLTSEKPTSEKANSEKLSSGSPQPTKTPMPGSQVPNSPVAKNPSQPLDKPQAAGNNAPAANKAGGKPRTGGLSFSSDRVQANQSKPEDKQHNQISPSPSSKPQKLDSPSENRPLNESTPDALTRKNQERNSIGGNQGSAPNSNPPLKSQVVINSEQEEEEGEDDFDDTDVNGNQAQSGDNTKRKRKRRRRNRKPTGGNNHQVVEDKLVFKGAKGDSVVTNVKPTKFLN